MFPTSTLFPPPCVDTQTLEFLPPPPASPLPASPKSSGPHLDFSFSSSPLSATSSPQSLSPPPRRYSLYGRLTHDQPGSVARRLDFGVSTRSLPPSPPPPPPPFLESPFLDSLERRPASPPPCTTPVPPGTPKTPTSMKTKVVIPITPEQRVYLRVGERAGGELQLSVRGVFTHEKSTEITAEAEGPLGSVYSLKVAITSPGNKTVLQERRYFGETEQKLAKRASQHASSVNSAREERQTSFSRSCHQMKQEMEPGQHFHASIGVLFSTRSQEELDEAEKEVIDRGREVYGDGLININRGGGGGCVRREKSTLSNAQVQREFKKHLKQFPYQTKEVRLNEEGRIAHTFTKQELTLRNVVYVFERTIPGIRERKRYVGISEEIEGRFADHFSTANNPESSKLIDKTFYEDLHKFWSQFRVGLISADSILAQGATLSQLETIAIKVLHSRKKPNGSGGYNLNNGGGGGASKKKDVIRSEREDEYDHHPHKQPLSRSSQVHPR